jgi:hypothetical protein
VDHSGDFLLEIFHSRVCIANNWTSGWYDSDYGRVPHMLLHESEDVSEFKGYTTDRGINRDSILYLLQLTRDVKQNPVRLTRLLVQIAKADLEFVLIFKDILCAVDLRDMIEVVKKYCLGNDETSHIRYSHELATIFTRWRDTLVFGWHTDWGLPKYEMKEDIEREKLTERCTKVIHGLLAPRVTRFGLRARGSIACARPVVAADAATGWLRMHL